MKNDVHIQRMLAKQYNFDIKHILISARGLSAINNWTLVQAILVLIAVLFVLGFIFIQVFSIQQPEDVQNMSNTQNALTSLAINVVLAPIFAGIAMLAISTARGLPTKAINVFSYVSYILPLGVASLLVSIATDIGMMMLVLPAFYVFMATTFTLPLIVDKKLTPFSAIILSVRMTNAYLYQMTLIFLIFIALFVGVILTFGFALIWVGPFFFNVKAILYTELFCTHEVTDSNEPKDPGVFDA